MNGMQHTVLTELRNLALQHHWESVIKLIDVLQVQTTSTRLLLMAPDDVDTTSISSWIKGVVSDTEVIVQSTSQQQDISLVISADKVLVVFACGQLIDAETVEMVLSSIFIRPQGSYAIALSQAEHIQTEQDVDLVERGMRRLFLAGRTFSTDPDNLLAQGIYLWSTNATQDHWLQPRLQRDSKALIQWLQTPLREEPSIVAELERYQTLAVLQYAENEVQHALRLSQAASATVDHTHRIYRAKQSIAELKEQLLSRMMMNVEGIERSMRISLQTLQADLRDGLPRYLQTVPQLTCMDEQMFRNVIANFISTRAIQWQSNANRLLITHEADTANEIESFVEGIDWRMINKALIDHGQTGGYPTVLIERLQGHAPNSAPQFTLEEGVPRWIASNTNGQAPMALTSMLQMAAGAGITSSIALLLRFGPLGIVASGVAGLVGAGLLALKGGPNHCMEAYEQYGQEAIQLVIRQVTQRIEEQVQAYKRALHQLIEVEMSRLEQLLDQALREHRQPDIQSAPATALLDQLQAYKRQIS
jgi:hypothetical protein